MSASYKKLWKILIDRDMNKSDLIRQAKITSNIVAKMGKGEDVSMVSLFDTIIMVKYSKFL